MARQTKPRKSDPKSNVVGKGKITPAQVALIVDRYLADNNFSGTRSLFRSEASSLLANCRVKEAPGSMLSLVAMLDEYLCLKEQKVIVDQTKYQLALENARVQSLLHGMQGLLSAYNSPAAPNCPTPPPLPSSYGSVVLSPAGDPAFKAPLTTSESILDHSQKPTRKRKSFKAVLDASEPNKKSCGLTSDDPSTSQGKSVEQPRDHVTSPQDNLKATSISQSVIPKGPPVQGSIVAKSLFNSSSVSPNSNSSSMQTPQRSTSSHRHKSISPREEISSAVKPDFTSTPVETTPTNCTIIASKTVIVNSPAKNYSIDRKYCSFSSPSKRDHVKGRLDFDTTDLPMISETTSPDVCMTSESDMDGDIFDFDFESLGPNFSLSELLHDFGVDCGSASHSCQEAIDASTGPLIQPKNGGDFHVSKDLTTRGSDSITSVKSITQCIQIISPAKKATNS